MTDHLLRRLAPISSEGWELLDAEAKDRLTVALGARRLVDFAGPHGWEHSATNLGRVGPVVSAPAEQVIARTRRVLPLTEVRADFSLQREELVNASRGAVDVDLGALDEAAHRIASVENAAVFNGWDAVGIAGIVPSSPTIVVSVLCANCGPGASSSSTLSSFVRPITASCSAVESRAHASRSCRYFCTTT
jgi:uncharacterized linocin/CFP29 family protein